MSRFSRRKFLSGVAAVPFVARAGVARAEAAYPNKPITIIVPFAPSGGTDVVARVVQPRLAQALGQKIIIENHDGGAGNVGIALAAHAKPDGYTVLITNVGSSTINPSLFPNLAVKPTRDLKAVTILTDIPSLFIADPKLPFKDVKGFVDYAHAHPGQVNFASPGTGSLNRMEMELLRSASKLDVVHVPYNGSSTPALLDIMGGHVSVLYLTVTAALNQAKAGLVKTLAITSKQRLPILPNVPTMVEQGYPDFVTSQWQGMFVPAATPKPIIDKLYQACSDTLKDPAVNKRFGELGMTAALSASPDAAQAYLVSETKRWGDMVARFKIKAD